MRYAIRRKLLVLLILASPLAHAASCSLNTISVTFGSYDAFSSQPLDSTGSVAVQCDVSTGYTITLSPGAGTYGSRHMTDGVHTVDYNLYVDAAHSMIWGDGTGGTSTVTDSSLSGTYTVYGRIPAQQNAFVGTYSDNLTVTVSF